MPKCDDLSTDLHNAVRSEDIEMVKNMIRDGFDVSELDQGGYIPLHDAAELGSLEIVQHLIENRANINLESSAGSTPLYAAAYHGRDDVARELLANGANVDQSGNGWTPLFIAVLRNNVDVTRQLLIYNANIHALNSDVGENWATPLRAAQHFARTEIAQLLIDHNDPELSEWDVIDCGAAGK